LLIQVSTLKGGGTLVNALVSVNGTTAFVDFDDLSFTGVTLTAAGALIYIHQTQTLQ